MELTTKRIGLVGSGSSAILSHKGVSLEWNITTFYTTVLKENPYDIFKEINGFWAQLPEATQDQIFDVYQRIRNVFNSVWDTNDLTKELYALVAELYSVHSVIDIDHWIRFHTDLQIPAVIPASFSYVQAPAPISAPPIITEELEVQSTEGAASEADQAPEVPEPGEEVAPAPTAFVDVREIPRTRERTYIKEDYRWLVALSVALRAMVPIWGEFISVTAKETGNRFKEYYAYQLLSFSSIVDSEPMKRLQVFIENSIPSDKPISAAIISGISTEDLPEWLMGIVVLRRLTVGDVRGLAGTAHLVSYVHGYIVSRIKSLEGSGINIVKPKIAEGANVEGENNLSKLENYKTKQDVPAGDIVTMEFFMQDIEGVAKRIAPDMNLSLLSESLRSVRKVMHERIWDPQLILMQWVLKPVISPRGLLSLTKPSILDAMAITQAILWHRGYKELSGLVSAIAESNEEIMQLGGSSSLGNLTKDMKEQLALLYPYTYKQPGEPRGSKLSNPAISAIESVTEMLTRNDWRLTLPNSWVEHLTGNRDNRRYSAPYDTKMKLATLAIAIAQRKF